MYSTLHAYLAAAGCEDTSRVFEIMDYCVTPKRRSTEHGQGQPAARPEAFAEAFEAAVPQPNDTVVEANASRALDCMGGLSVASYDQLMFDLHWQVGVAGRAVDVIDPPIAVAVEEVARAIRSLNRNRAADITRIRSDLLSDDESTCELIAAMLNACVQNGVPLPDDACTGLGRALPKT
ncbi:MAG: hypothetical protein KDA51_08925, partial [Planctomycetales bacterium]|nr:hypothetical protein [Planctomycetales bacterium]